MNKLQKRIREVEEEHAEEFVVEHLKFHEQKERDNALLLLGRIQATDRISAQLYSQVIRALMEVQATKAYKSLGYEVFVDYLNDADMSPITKNQFYDGKNLIDKEGDVLFNLLNQFGIPIYKRKLLGKGNISLDGETVIVKDEQGNETTIEINDQTRLIETLTALVDLAEENRNKLSKEKEKTQKLEQKLIDANAETDRVKALKAIESNSPHSDALMNLMGAYVALTEEAGKLLPIEKEQLAPRTFSMIAGLMNRLSEAYDRKSWEKDLSVSRPLVKDEDDEFIEKFLEEENDDELANLM